MMLLAALELAQMNATTRIVILILRWQQDAGVSGWVKAIFEKIAEIESK
jgi:hypothetical protein